MNDVERMLLEVIKPSLVALERKKLGCFNKQEDEGIYYIFNNKEYLISVKEVED